jgi:hypothetical protein
MTLRALASAKAIERMVADHPMNRLDELLPWNWVKNHVKTKSGATAQRS